MPLELRAQIAEWPLAGIFTISRGSKTQATVVEVTIEEGGVIGRGECVPYSRYDETIESVMDQIRGAEPWLATQAGPGATRTGLVARLPAGAARNAIDCALWDLEAKQQRKRVWQLASCDPPQAVVTAYTLSLGSAEAMGNSAFEHAHRPLLKLKLDRNQPIERVTAVRNAAPNAQLIVDANEAWRPDDLTEWLPALAELGVELVEQPLPAGSDDALGGLSSPIPIGADESCHTVADLERLLARYQMVNIKLDKTGGLTEALALRSAAMELGLEFMVGCMVGTSLSMAPATLLTPGARFVDLDGPLLLAHDRVPGLHYGVATVHPPDPSVWG